ncbi:hypothetical protein ZOSMA_288G00170 [Zostera marina]|uniref:Uncharacterized protein n=1 Tax=Zostera marina TaxID=29655 RepID=A0A0K9PCW5_ZOSMR|nr:hypothetical protein ZOSMA_288G00170 [Zostera marina]
MAYQEGSGWPLGFQPLSMRIRSNDDLSFRSMSDSPPPSFTDSSSDFDTESSRYFF